MRLLLPFLLLAITSFGQTASEKIDSTIKEFVIGDAPGAAVVVVKNSEVIYNKGFGLANVEYKILNTPTTIFDIASVSKQFAGYAIATLIEQKKINPTDDIRKYIPEFPKFAQTITINHLVHHTSGLRDWPEALYIAGWRWSELFSFEDIMRMLMNQKELDFPPGSKYSYSNTGYNVLAEVVYRVTGEKFPEWIDKNVFTPLKMDSSLFLANAHQVIPSLASSYYRQGPMIVHAPSYLTAYGSSSMFTSTTDLSSWMIHALKMWKEKDPVFTRMIEEGKLNSNDNVPYAFGLGIGTFRGTKMISHSGSWAGYRSMLYFFPEHEIAVAILANTPQVNVGKALDIAAALIPDVQASQKEDVKPTMTDLVTPSTGILNRYTGTYKLAAGWLVDITLVNSRLMTRATNEDAFPLYAITDTSFWVPAYNAAIHFQDVKKGKAQQFKYKTFVAPRITPHTPLPADLPEYTGRFYSDELKIFLDVQLQNDTLHVVHPRHGKMLLKSEEKDVFNSNLGSHRFLRNGKSITGFRLSASRVKNLLFRKM